MDIRFISCKCIHHNAYVQNLLYYKLYGLLCPYSFIRYKKRVSLNMGETEQRPTTGSRLGAQENAGISTLEHGEKPPMTPPGKLVSIKIQMLDDTQETFEVPVRMWRVGWLKIVQAFLKTHVFKPVLFLCQLWFFGYWIHVVEKMAVISAWSRWRCNRITLNSEVNCKLHLLFFFFRRGESPWCVVLFTFFFFKYYISGFLYFLNSWFISVVLFCYWPSKL